MKFRLVLLYKMYRALHLRFHCMLPKCRGNITFLQARSVEYIIYVRSLNTVSGQKLLHIRLYALENYQGAANLTTHAAAQNVWSKSTDTSHKILLYLLQPLKADAHFLGSKSHTFTTETGLHSTKCDQK
jgi:hypothetical protein